MQRAARNSCARSALRDAAFNFFFLFDLTTLEGSAFEPLRQESVQHTVAVFHGAVTWLDGEIDCSPEYLYAHSYAYTAPDMVG